MDGLPYSASGGHGLPCGPLSWPVALPGAVQGLGLLAYVLADRKPLCCFRIIQVGDWRMHVRAAGVQPAVGGSGRLPQMPPPGQRLGGLLHWEDYSIGAAPAARPGWAWSGPAGVGPCPLDPLLPGAALVLPTGPPGLQAARDCSGTRSRSLLAFANEIEDIVLGRRSQECFRNGIGRRCNRLYGPLA